MRYGPGQRAGHSPPKTKRSKSLATREGGIGTPSHRHSAGHEAASIAREHGAPAGHRYLARQNLAEPLRSKATAQKEGGIVHQTREPREAGIGRRPRAGPLVAKAVAAYTRSQNASASAGDLGHALDTLGHHYKHNPISRSPIIGRKGLLGAAEDLVKTSDPIALEQTLTKTVSHPLASRSSHDLNAGIVVPGFGGRFSFGKKAKAPVEEAAGSDLFGKESVARPRTKPEAEARLRKLDRQLEGLYRKVGKSIGHPLAEGDIAQEIGRSRTLFGTRAKGRSVEGRAHGQPVKRASVPEQLRAAAQDALEQTAKKHPEHPMVKAWQEAETERASLMQALHGHMPGEDRVGDLGSVSEERYAPGEQVRRSLGNARRQYAQEKKMRSEALAGRVEKGMAAREAAGGGIEGQKAFARELRGPFPKAKFENLSNWSTADLERATRFIQESPELRPLEVQTATESLRRAVQENKTPTPHEIRHLVSVFGKSVEEPLKKVSLRKKIGRHMIDVVTIPRSLETTLDVSFGGRQGFVMAAAYPRLFGPNWLRQFKSLASEAEYQEFISSIEGHPLAEQARDANLPLTKLGDVTELGQREEYYPSQMAERIPLVGRVVHASGRAFTQQADANRMAVFEHVIDKARRAGVNVEETKFLRDTARFAGVITGRGGLGKAEGAGPLLNAGFFAPRLISARLAMLNPAWYASLHPFVRREAAKAAIRAAAAGSLVLFGLNKGAGAVIGTDPLSADFLKAKLGNTRVDPFAGFPVYLRLAAQIYKGKIVSSTTGREIPLRPGFAGMSRADVVIRFGRSKLNPTAAYIADAFYGTDFAGKPFEWKKAVYSRMYPLVLQDTYDLYHDTKSVPFASLGYVTAALGVGMQTYHDTTAEAFGNKAKDLRASFLKELDGKLPPKLDQQLQVYTARYSAYKKAHISTADHDYQPKALAVDTTLLVRMGVIDGAMRRQWLHDAKGMTKDEIIKQREQIHDAYFPTDWLNATAKALGLKVPR